MARYLAPVALLPGGWAENVVFEVDSEGSLQSVTEGLATVAGSVDARLPGAVVPGVVNGHSHAFQRALAGGAETRTAAGDSFWTWRDQMYRLLGSISPEAVEAVAAQLYVELLRQGYTRVVEFHYLHNDPTGAPYGDPTEMARRIVRAAERAGIGLTLVPVLYRTSDFGGVPPTEGQRRFVLEVDSFLQLVEAVQDWSSSLVSPGFAFHSLRAVTPREMEAVLESVAREGLPCHIHVAEQPREVEACRNWYGMRPVEWLLDQLPVGPDWHLIHCTHMVEREIQGLARSGATAVVCPTTEANLGDGIFPLQRFQSLGGSLAVGSDSHVSTSPVEELRWLEYAQRLVQGSRAVAADQDTPSVARALLTWVWEGGARSAGIDAGRLAPGQRADFVVLDRSHPVLTGRSGDGLLDAWIFSGNDTPVREVWVAGRRVVVDGRHPEGGSVASSFRAVMRRLLAPA